jgi:transcriptional regulator with XRE-family HTH domain
MLRLQAERIARGWSLAETSRHTGVNAVTIGWIETGRFLPYEKQLKKIARAFGFRTCDAPGLLDEVSEPPTASRLARVSTVTSVNA